MAWARIDDAFFNHPKVRKAGKDAVIFHMAALCHSNAFTTDGFIADDMLELIAVQAFQRRANGLADRLVECGLWDRIEGGYLIHDYLEYNYSKQQVQEIKSKRSSAGKQGGRPTISKIEANEKQNESKTKANSKQNESHTHTHINTHTNTDNNPTNLSSSIAEKGDDDDVYKAFETIGACTPQTKKSIDQAVASYGAAWVKDAIAEGVVHGAKSFAYVSKILAGWKSNGKPATGKQPGADIEKFREAVPPAEAGGEVKNITEKQKAFKYLFDEYLVLVLKLKGLALSPSDEIKIFEKMEDLKTRMKNLALGDCANAPKSDKKAQTKKRTFTMRFNKVFRVLVLEKNFSVHSYEHYYKKLLSCIEGVTNDQCA